MSLPAQFVLALVALVVLTASALGIPAIWWMRDQFDRQAQALLQQDAQTQQVLLAARHTSLENLALLTAQRPTLLRLVEGRNLAELEPYLQTLQVGAGVDFVLVCDAAGQPLSQAGLLTGAQASSAFAACQAAGPTSVLRVELAGQPLGFLLATQAVALAGEKIVVGLALNQELMASLRRQPGEQMAFFYDGVYLASSGENPAEDWSQAPAGHASADPARVMFLGEPYLALRIPYLEANGASVGRLELAVALPTSTYTALQQQFTLRAVAAILAIIFFSSALGVFLARQISRPLGRLKEAAVALQMGDLATPVPAHFRVREIAQVAFALEEARVALFSSHAALAEEKAWADHLLESIVEGIVTLDRLGRITYFSPGAERIMGWQVAQVLGRPVDEVFVTPDGMEPFSKVVALGGGAGGQMLVTVLFQGQPAAAQAAAKGPLNLAVTGARLAPPEAGRASTALVLRDISDEQAIRRLLGGFLANITHEFRTPLSALAASIELLRDQLDTLSLPEIRELVDSQHLGILGLQTLIDNLLEGASIEAGRFRVNPRSADLGAILAETMRTMLPLLGKYHQRLQNNVPAELPLVRADPRRTQQVLVNLFSNAIKWSPEGAEIHLNAAHAGGFVRVAVADAGPGISPSQKDEIFGQHIHSRLSNQRAEYGAGLGLSVVKAIVEAQGGQVGIADWPGGGSEFWFTLPVAEEVL